MSHSSKPLCKTYQEELKAADSNLTFSSACPVCDVAVGHHNRRPAAASAASAPFDMSALKEILAATIVLLVVLGGHSRSVDVPKWSLSEWKHTRPFLDRCEQVFLADNIPQSRWPVLLLKAVTDVAESAWIKTNVVDTSSTWEQAKTRFTNHFESYSYKAQLERTYQRVGNNLKERTQKYADRFQQIRAQLAYDESSEFVIKKYIDGLASPVRRKYDEMIMMLEYHMEAQATQDKLSTLTSVINLSLKADAVLYNYTQADEH